MKIINEPSFINENQQYINNNKQILTVAYYNGSVFLSYMINNNNTSIKDKVLIFKCESFLFKIFNVWIILY